MDSYRHVAGQTMTASHFAMELWRKSWFLREFGSNSIQNDKVGRPSHNTAISKWETGMPKIGGYILHLYYIVGDSVVSILDPLFIIYIYKYR